MGRAVPSSEIEERIALERRNDVAIQQVDEAFDPPVDLDDEDISQGTQTIVKADMVFQEASDGSLRPENKNSTGDEDVAMEDMDDTIRVPESIEGLAT